MHPASDIDTLSHPRSVPVTRAFAWFSTAMSLFKRAPGRWSMLAAISICLELALQIVPGVGIALSKVLIPVVASGLLVAAEAVDRGKPLDMRYALVAFGAPVSALAAIIGSELLVFLSEWLAGYSLAGINLLDSGGEAPPDISLGLLLQILTVGMLVSLPVVFVPFAALFEGAPFGAAFAMSWRAFFLNQGALLVYGVLSLALIGIGMMSMGIGLIIAVPLIAAASYAAWKDIFTDAPGGPAAV